MTRKKTKADAAQADAVTTTTEIPIESPVETTTAVEEPAPEAALPKKGKKGSKKKATADVTTLADLAAGYLAHMEEVGKSDGTISSYRMELKTAAAELGEETPIADLTPGRVQTFFDSVRVTKLRSGRAKAKPSIDKTRRVLRLALTWAVEAGLIEKAPLPEPVPAK
jgi:hypothetical protein